jgi:hypothetical protein
MAEHLQLGQAGVLRVASELLLRGIVSYFPSVDDHGVDILTTKGLRLQVKAAKLHTRQIWQTKQSGYFFTLGWSSHGARKQHGKRAKKYSDQCDYIVFWGVDESRFWIVPSFLVDSYQCLRLGPKPRPSVDAIKKLVEQGKSFREVGAELGIDHHTVSRRMKTDLLMGGRAQAVRLCEGRWEFLAASKEDVLLESQAWVETKNYRRKKNESNDTPSSVEGQPEAAIQQRLSGGR